MSLKIWDVKDGSGMIDFPEFLMMMALKADYENAEDQIREAFQVFDRVRLGFLVSSFWAFHKDGNGFINRFELSSVMINMSIELNAEEIQVMVMRLSILVYKESFPEHDWWCGSGRGWINQLWRVLCHDAVSLKLVAMLRVNRNRTRPGIDKVKPKVGFKYYL